jgi:hypothetical protein
VTLFSPSFIFQVFSLKAQSCIEQTRRHFGTSNLSPIWARELMMGTNPKLPDYPQIPPQKPGNQHARVQVIKKSKFPWPILILIVGAAIVAGIIYFLPRAPRSSNVPLGAQAPQQPTPQQIQLTNLNMAPAPTGGALYLTGMLHNAGSTVITGVQVRADFLDADGKNLESDMRPVEGIVSGSATQGMATQNLTQAPIQPNQSRPIRIYFERTPAGWNHQMPQLTVTTVTATTTQ